MILSWTERAWEDYQYWQQHDSKVLKRLNTIIRDTLRHPYSGIAKPESLKWELEGAWSRRIDVRNRLIYLVVDDELRIIQAHDHY